MVVGLEVEQVVRCGCLSHGEPVVLQRSDWESAMVVGAARHLPNVVLGRSNPLHREGDFGRGLLHHVNGAGGEIAAGIALGIRPILSTDFSERGLGDLEGGHEVRTRPEPHLDLGIREGDDDCRRWILVLGRLPRYWVIGWIFGRDAKKPGWLRKNNGFAPTYYVPHGSLIPMERWSG
jgi:hypothetical protein